MKKSEQIRDKCTPSVRENSLCRKLAMETAQPIVERSGVFEKMDIENSVSVGYLAPFRYAFLFLIKTRSNN